MNKEDGGCCVLVNNSNCVNEIHLVSPARDLFEMDFMVELRKKKIRFSLKIIFFLEDEVKEKNKLVIN